MSTYPDNTAAIQRRLRYFAVGAGAAAAAIGALHLIAWWAGLMAWRGFGAIAMNSNAALCLLLSGVALSLAAAGRRGRWGRLSSRAMAAAAMILGGLTLLEHALGWDLGIDQLLVREPNGALGVLHPNRMCQPGAFSFTLGGAAILLLLGRREALWRAAQRLGLVLCLVPLSGVLGYLYGAGELYGAALPTAIAWPTTVALILLATGVLCARPGTGLTARIISPDPGGAAMRRLLPAALVLPVLLGWLRLQGEWHGLYERHFGTSMMVLFFILIFSLLVYQTGCRISGLAQAGRESEERFRVAQDLSPDGFTILRPLRDAQGQIVDFVWVYENPAIARANGTDPRDVVGRRVLELFPEHGQTVFYRSYREVAATGEPRVIEASFGLEEQAWFRVAVVPLGGDLAILTQDITEKKLAEEQLRLSEEKFAKAFAQNASAMAMTRLDDGLFLEVNETWQTMFGFGREEAVGRTALDLHFWSSAAERQAVMELLREKGSIRDLELTLPRRSGEICVTLTSAEVLVLAGEKVTLWSLIDITDRKRAEEALREREAQLHLFIEHAPAALGMFDRDMRYLYASRRWSDLYNLDQGDLRGRSHYELFPEITEDWKEAHRRGMAGDVLRAEADRFQRADGSVQWIRWEIRPWYEATGEVGGIVIFAEDMTAVKRAEDELRGAKEELEARVRERTRELERTYNKLHRETEERLTALETLRRNERLLLQQSRLAAMGEMLGNIAHQWRQPLNTLALLVQDLLLNEELGELNAQYLENAVQKAMKLILHMSQTIDDFRGFLQPEKEKTRFSVNEAVSAAISLFEASMRTMEVDLQVRESEALVIEGHRNEFCQVIINLLTNARDAFKERGIEAPRLLIELGKEQGKNVITVTDNAGGVADEIIDRIFDPYFTTKGPDKGTGIGLFMSKNIIEKSMHGSLTVMNTGEGAQFRIEL